MAGCSTQTPGLAGPVSGVSQTVTKSQRPTTTSSSGATAGSKPSGTGPLAGVLPCSFLTNADRAQLGLKSTPKEIDEGDRRACQFSEKDVTTSVTIFDDLGLDSVDATDSDARPVPVVGRHKALQSMFGITCAVTMEITATSIVSATASGNTDAESCEIAMKMAQAVERNLP
ncbi:DUF3558 family protein [Actinokineospora sp.]|uniref:DUF3558 family protein n=1 Tax=Actinokineospora sp. TaxID=1872133 RepID=UPI004037D405